MARRIFRGAALGGCLAAFPLGAECFTPKDSAHCLRWEAGGSAARIRAEGTFGAAGADEPLLCRRAPRPQPPGRRGAAAARFADTCEADLAADASIGANSTHLAVGTMISSSGSDRRCVPIRLGRAGAAAAVAAGADDGEEVAQIDASCDVWWREVSADVIPPIPELVLAFGVTPAGHRLGLCRTFGAEPAVDGGRKIVGTIVLEGPDFGQCFFTRDDGSRGSLNGGMFHVLQARASEPSCADDAALTAELRQGLQRRLDAFLTAADRETIAAVSGAAFGDLAAGLMRLGSCELKQVLSPARFYPSPLNTLGLHSLRALLAERMADARVEAQGLHVHEDYAAWKRDGVLVKDFAEVGDAGLHRLLQMASGERHAAIPLPPYNWTERAVTVTDAKDPQNDMHIDTFAGIVKVWLFDESIGPEHGPLEYVPGSHREGVARLRWMHAYSQPPAVEALIEPSFRLKGSRAAAKAAPDFVEGSLSKSKLVLPVPGAKRTLVIADTSGLHRRARGEVGRIRRSWRMVGDNDGGLKRLDPYRWPAEPVGLQNDSAEL